MAVLEAPERHQDLIEELIAEVSEYNADVDRDLLESEGFRALLRDEPLAEAA